MRPTSPSLACSRQKRPYALLCDWTRVQRPVPVAPVVMHAPERLSHDVVKLLSRGAIAATSRGHHHGVQVLHNIGRPGAIRSARIEYTSSTHRAVPKLI